MPQSVDWQRCVQVLTGNASRRTAKRRRVRQHMPESYSERVHVRPSIYFAAAKLFRARVVRRPQKYARRGSGRIIGNACDHFDQTEIDDFDYRPILLVERDYKIGWLDVPMHQFALMSHSKSSRDLRSDLQSEFFRQCPAQMEDLL